MLSSDLLYEITSSYTSSSSWNRERLFLPIKPILLWSFRCRCCPRCLLPTVCYSWPSECDAWRVNCFVLFVGWFRVYRKAWQDGTGWSRGNLLFSLKSYDQVWKAHSITVTSYRIAFNFSNVINRQYHGLQPHTYKLEPSWARLFESRLT